MPRMKHNMKKTNHNFKKIYHYEEDIINLQKIKIFIKNLSLNKLLQKIKSSYKQKFDSEVFKILLDAAENLIIELFMNSHIKNKNNQISNSYELIREREIIKIVETGNYIDYIYKIKKNDQELLLVFDNSANIILYDLKTYKMIFKKIFFLKFNRILGLSELDNEMIMVSSKYSLNIIIIEKDETNHFCLYEVINSIFNINLNKKIVKSIKLQTNNILILFKKSFSIYSSQYNNKVSICCKIGNPYFESSEKDIKKILPNYVKILTHITSQNDENLDVIEFNKDIIIYYDTNYCNIYSMNNKQTLFSIKVNVSANIDDVLKKISDDIFCIGEKNIIEFISIKLGKVIDKIIFPNSVSLCATGLLKNNNILIGSIMDDNNFVRKLYLTQFQYFINNKDDNIIHINFNYSMILGHGLGNIFIIELDDGRILFTSKDSIFFLNK